MNKYKKVALIMNGKKLRDIYPYATPSQVFKYKLVRFIKKVLSYALVVLLFGISVMLVSLYFPKYKIVEKEVMVDNLTPKIANLKGELLATLKQCESGGRSEDFGLVTFDPHPTNKKVQVASFGSYQFKASTVQHYYKTLYGQDITGKEAILIALDDNKAGQLASDIIFKTSRSVSEWFNCSNKHDLKSKVAVIKNLEK